MQCASRAFFPTRLLPCTKHSHGRHSPRFACLLFLFTLARIACLLHICVKKSRSITLFGPRPNNKPRVLKITVTHAVCTWRCWTLPLLRFERKRMQLVYKFTLLNKILRNHVLSEHMQWDYTPFNVKINRLTSISSNEITKLSYLQVFAFDIQLFELNFYSLVSERWRSGAQLTWPSPAQMVVESRSTDFPVEWIR